MFIYFDRDHCSYLCWALEDRIVRVVDDFKDCVGHPELLSRLNDCVVEFNSLWRLFSVLHNDLYAGLLPLDLSIDDYIAGCDDDFEFEEVL